MVLSKNALPRDGNFIPIQDSVGRILGIPYVGNIYYVDPTNGSDTANSGRKPTDAYKTLATAEDDMTSFNHDVVILLSGGTDATIETATITWDKSYCHLLGNAAPSHHSPRARVEWTTDSVDPCFTMSGNGNIFKNVQFVTLKASNDVLVNLTGDRSFFENVHFFGMGHTTAGDDTSARHIAMTGAVNNRFKHCVIGDDTIPRSQANASVSFASASSKNLFEDCFFTMRADDNRALHVLSTGATGISGVNEFRNCTWFTQWVNQADKIAAAFDLSAQTQTCAVLMSGNQLLVGADDWEASASGLMWFNAHSDGTDAALIGLGENNAT